MRANGGYKKSVMCPMRRASGGRSVIGFSRKSKSGNNSEIDFLVTPRTFRLNGLLNRKSYQRIPVERRKTRPISRATFVAIFGSRMEVKTVKSTTRSKLPSAKGNDSA